jgi:hypothetical protein
MSLLTPENARIQTVVRASAGEVDRYGQHKEVVAFNNFLCRFDPSDRVDYTSDGQTVVIDATIIVSRSDIQLLPGDKIKMDMPPEHQYRVVSTIGSQDHLGVVQFRTYSCVRVR